MYRGIEVMGQLIEQERLAIIKKRIYWYSIIGWLFVVIGTSLIRVNLFHIILVFIGTGLMIYGLYLLFFYNKKVKNEILDYYAAYKLPNGKWQTTAIYENKEEAIEDMRFHAQGRKYIVAESEEELESKKNLSESTPQA